MQIEIEQIQHEGGTIEVACSIYKVDEHKTLWLNSEISVAKLRNSYQLRVSGSKSITIPSIANIFIDTDIVTNPKHLEETDWQLLRILNPQVSSVQWSIFKLLKDLVDARTEEDYTIDQIKQILGE